MSNKFNVNVVNEKHKRLDKNIKITTISKKNKTKILVDDVIMVAESMIKQNPKKKLMIKCLSDSGYFQLKGYSDDLDVILQEEDYFGGRETTSHGNLYKASFYLM